MIEVDGIASSSESLIEIKFGAVGQQRAGDDGRMRRALVFDDHSRSGALHVRRRLLQNAPACFGDLRDIGLCIHLGENHQCNRVTGVEGDAEVGEQPCETLSQRSFRRTREISVGDVERKPVFREPFEALDGRRPASFAALPLMDLPRVMVDGDPDRQPVTIALTQR
jgi:hypothetical protein